jgi:hypothetical protein
MIRRTSYMMALSITFVLALSSMALAQDQACDDFPNQAAAQQALRAAPSDPDGLDGPPGPESHGINGVACEQLPGPKDLTPVLPSGNGAGGGSPTNSTGAADPPPGGASSQAGGPSGGASSQVSSQGNRELLDAGGDLPVPYKAASDNVLPPDDGGPFPWGPALIIVLCSGLLVFLVRELVADR